MWEERESTTQDPIIELWSAVIALKVADSKRGDERARRWFKGEQFKFVASCFLSKQAIEMIEREALTGKPQRQAHADRPWSALRRAAHERRTSFTQNGRSLPCRSKPIC
jgi:hypothetical protein